MQKENEREPNILFYNNKASAPSYPFYAIPTKGEKGNTATKKVGDALVRIMSGVVMLGAMRLRQLKIK
jgi:hypothetical protein